MGSIILVIDEGTTSTRAIAYDRSLNERAVSQREIPLAYPDDGWVEQDPEQIWQSTLAVCREVIAAVGGAGEIAAIGITNQRETTLVWNRQTGVPIGPAIVWQDRRTARQCEALKAQGHEAAVQGETGLLLDPYFSATKIAWLLDRTPGARELAARGELAFGTVDTFLLWRLTAGKVHATDVTNASRTLLFPLDGATGMPADGWSDRLCALFGVPKSLMPHVKASSAQFGATHVALFGRPIPVLAVIGDQQAALVGQGCMKPDTAKITYGTGAFLVANSGTVTRTSSARLLRTIGYEVGGQRAFALEGSIFNAGTIIKWLRDDLGLIANAAESEARAAALPDNGGVYCVPAFTGLGAPHWDAEARGALLGMTRSTNAAHIVRAGLEAVAYQTADLLDAFARDATRVAELRVDGGMVANDWLMQFIADICGVPVIRPDYREMTALGAAALASFELGWWNPTAWTEREVAGTRFLPALAPARRDGLRSGWQRALSQVLTRSAG